jgi:hypothetical protein
MRGRPTSDDGHHSWLATRSKHDAANHPQGKLVGIEPTPPAFPPVSCHYSTACMNKSTVPASNRPVPHRCLATLSGSGSHADNSLRCSHSMPSVAMPATA